MAALNVILKTSSDFVSMTLFQFERFSILFVMNIFDTYFIFVAKMFTSVDSELMINTRYSSCYNFIDFYLFAISYTYLMNPCVISLSDENLIYENDPLLLQ